mmetsp:Transcript_121221/g.258753  ORF Transcript_121221/g.258753 Transcript_121221/m.258753 type:complete len:319 (-) Transcript_121221:2052-3008(-)
MVPRTMSSADDILEGFDLLPLCAAVFVDGHDRITQPHPAHTRNVREQCLSATGHHTVDGATVTVEDTDNIGGGVRRVLVVQWGAREEFLGSVKVRTRGSSIVSRAGSKAASALAILLHMHTVRSDEGIRLLAIRKAIRVPCGQWCEVHHLERNRPRPPLLSSATIPLYAQRAHPSPSRHGSPEVGVVEAALPDVPPHRILPVRGIISRIIGDIQRLPTTPNVRTGFAQGAVGEVGPVAVLARDLLHQFVQEAVLQEATWPSRGGAAVGAIDVNVGGGWVHLEARLPRVSNMFRGAVLCEELGVQVGGHAKARGRQVLL